MPRSIQVFKYDPCPSIGTIHKELVNGKTVKKELMDKMNPGKMKTFKTKFSKVYKKPEGIGGTIEHEFQQKVRHTEDQYIPVTPSITFFIIPDHRIMILHGTEDVRSKVLEIIEETLSGNIGYIEDFRVKKHKQDAFVNKIRAEHTSNKIHMHKNKNDRLGNRVGIKSSSVTMHPGVCATTTPDYEENLEKASSFNCKLELVKCSGLIDEEIEKPERLTIRDNMSFSFTKDIEPRQWNRFILHKCLPLFN